jgi:hypothetical protein
MDMDNNLVGEGDVWVEADVDADVDEDAANKVRTCSNTPKGMGNSSMREEVRVRGFITRRP